MIVIIMIMLYYYYVFMILIWITDNDLALHSTGVVASVQMSASNVQWWTWESH